MIIEKLTEKDIPPIVKAFPLSELCSEDDLKAASDLVVSEYDVGYEYPLKAGGTGLNLVGADTVIHYDPWWNLAVQNQATDRAHRIGKTKNVTVYRLILKGTIEEKILELQKTKKDLAESILEGNNRL